MASTSDHIFEIIQKSSEKLSYEDAKLEREKLRLNKPALLNYICNSVIGDRILFKTPFGNRPLVYADYTASGRALSFIENYMRDIILPNYANTHTSTSWVGLQTGFFRSEARSIIERCVGATDDDIVIFCGSGSTAAINKLAEIMKQTNWGHKHCYFKENKYGSFDCTLCGMVFNTQGNFLSHVGSPVHQANLCRVGEHVSEDFANPIVFLSVFEHHSNILP